MREWLTVIIVLLIIGILLDGVRRMRAYRKNALRMSRSIPDENGPEEAGSEFPSGGARVVGYRDADDVNNVTQNARANYTASRQTKGAPNRLPEQVALNLDVPVPMLMESFEGDGDQKAQNVELEDNVEIQNSGLEGAGEPSIGSLHNLDDVVESTPNIIEEEHPNYASSTYSPEGNSPPEAYESPLSGPSTSEPEQAQVAEEPENLQAPDMVLVINVMARRGEYFAGSLLLEALLVNGLRFGDMDIFHRHESSDGKGKILFSLANIVMPGTFDLVEMDQFETPGFSMFLSLPIAGDSLGAYNLMADTAQALAQELGGELKDEHRSVMTRQTIEHDRQRVIEYERKKRLERA